MTIRRTNEHLPARRRVELNRDVESRRLVRAVDAKRRLNAAGRISRGPKPTHTIPSTPATRT
jgi:hypothetical protein